MNEERAVSLPRNILRESCVLLFFLALTIWFTWPLATHLSRAVSDPGDPLLNCWIIDWDLHALTHDPLHLYDAPIFHPAVDALAFSENMVGIAIVVLPLKLTHVGPLALYNLAALLGFWMTAYAAYHLARFVTRSTPGAVAAGVFYSFNSFRFDHLPHLQILWAMWPPLLLLAFLKLYREPRWKTAFWFGVVFVMNGLTNIHWFVFGSTALFLTAVILSVFRRRWRYWIPLGSATAVSMLLLLPFLLPYRTVSGLYGMKRSAGENLGGSAEWIDWLAASTRSAVYGALTLSRDAPPERHLFPGIVALALAGLALFQLFKSPSREGRGKFDLVTALDLTAAISLFFVWNAIVTERSSAWASLILFGAIALRLWIRLPGFVATFGRSRSLREMVRESPISDEMLAAILWLVIGFFGSLGLRAFFYRFLFEHFSLFASIRTPARWVVVAYAGLAVLLSAGIAGLVGAKGPRQWVVGGLLLLFVIFDARPNPMIWFEFTDSAPPVYEWVKGAAIPGAILELPLSEVGQSEVLYQMGSTIHHKPLINGVSGFETPLHSRLTAMAQQMPVSPELIGELEAAGCSTIIVHADRIAGHSQAIRTWLSEQLASGRLTFLRRFDHELHGDWVFAVARNDRGASNLQAADLPDRAGRTPAQNLSIFLASNGPTYTNQTFGFVESPGVSRDFGSSDARPPVAWGDLTVKGWALSPNGVSSVIVFFDNGRVRVPAKLIQRLDIARAYPWYPEVRSQSFEAYVARRPPGRDSTTELQVEIRDGSGRKTRLPDLWFDWWLFHEDKPIPRSRWIVDRLGALLARLNLDVAGGTRAIVEGSTTIDRVAAPYIDREGVSDEAYVDDLYLKVMGRTADSKGKRLLLERLPAVGGRRKAFLAMIQSPEFAGHYLK